MTLKQLHTLDSNRKRLAESFRSLISTRNTIIDSFDKEYNRHVKLTSKKEEPRKALLDSILRSRNMKKIQKEFLENKTRIKENQAEAKLVKQTFQQARSTYESEVIAEKTKKIKTYNEAKCYND